MWLLATLALVIHNSFSSPWVTLTNKGDKVIARDPFEVLVRAVGSLDAEVRAAMHDALHRVLTTVAASGAHRHFGVCQDCAYLSGETRCSSTSAPTPPHHSRAAKAPLARGGRGACLLFGVPIEPEDAHLLCVHFQPKASTVRTA